MKQYTTRLLNKGMNWGRDKDLAKVDETLNAMVAEGWALEHVVSPNDVGGAIVGIFSKEKETE